MRVKCLAQEHNTMYSARALDPETSALTMRQPSNTLREINNKEMLTNAF